MADIDVLLRDAIARLAEPGDPAGVAAAIRTRLAAEGGAPSSGGSRKSETGGGSGPAGWLPWVGASVLLGLGGGIAGATGVFGTPPTDSSGIGGTFDDAVIAYGCPGGSPAVDLDPGLRVLAVERSEDGEWLAIRDPYALSRTVWLPAGVVVADEGEPSIESLPVGGCPVPSAIPSAIPSPTPTETIAPPPPPPPSPDPGPEPAPPPPPPPDTTQPTIGASGWSVSPVYGDTWTCGASSSTITITATDNVEVSTVSGSTTFPGASVNLQSHSGSTWVFVFQMPNANPDSGTAAVSFTAIDPSGNSRSVSAPLAVSYCLI